MTTRRLALAAAFIALSGAAAAAEDVHYVIEITSHDPPNVWASIARTLIERDLVAIRREAIRDRALGPCDTVLQALGFDKGPVPLGCSDGIQRLLADLEAGSLGSAGGPVPTGEVAFPDMPVKGSQTSVTYDRRDEAERSKAGQIAKFDKLILGQTFAPTPNAAPSETLQRVQVATYEVSLAVPDTTEADRLVRSLARYDESLGRDEVTVYRLDETQDYGPPNSFPSDGIDAPMGWWNKCRIDQWRGEKPKYEKLLNTTLQSCTCTTNCPGIVLFDGDVAENPDIRPALATPVDFSDFDEPEPAEPAATPVPRAAPAPVASAPRFCPFKPFVKTTDHATHLAGILVSQPAEQSFGGLAPFAALRFKDARLNTAYAKIGPIVDVARSISRFSADVSHKKVVLFATDWKRRTDLPNDRLRNPSYVQTIRGNNDLWVVSAGNAPENGDPIDLARDADMSPQNIGDQDNVVVVAACRNCFEPDWTLEGYSNYSTNGLVAVAAYGGEIPATVSETAYGTAQGTSQAAALVAGVVANMLCLYPNAYNAVREIKVRVTSAVSPPLDPDVATRIAGGVLDADKALLDPAALHITLDGAQSRKAKRVVWCRPSFEVISPTSGESLGLIDVTQLRRVIRNVNGTGESRWFFFQQRPETGSVERIGPAIPASDAAAPLLRVRFDGGEKRTVTLAEVDDILTPPYPHASFTEVATEDPTCR